MWNPDSYLEQLYRNAEPEFEFRASGEEEWKAWRDRLKGRFIELMGGFPDRPAPLEPALLEETACDGYVRQRVEMTTYAGLRMPVYVLVPDRPAGRPLPAVVAVHGHGYGSKEIVGLAPDGRTPSEDAGYQQNFAVELARRGFVVAAPELLGFGDRRIRADLEQGAYSSCQPISTYLLQMGQTMAGHRVYETLRAIDYVSGRSDIDASRIGCMGISGGGLVTAFAAAVDERIRSVVVSGYVNTFKASILAMHHCVDNYIPGLNRYAEMPDLVGLIAPRPLLVEAGANDPIFPVAAVHEAYGKLGRIYRLLDAEDKLELDLFEGDHRINGKVAYDWLSRRLGQ